MAHLTNDCFAGTQNLITSEEALQILMEKVTPIAGLESVILRNGCGRILAENVVSPINVPQYTNSAVDGYAVYFNDLHPKKHTVLPIGGHAAAGHPLGRTAHPGEAIRIFTGAPMPKGLDTVMMQEDCTKIDDAITVMPGIKQGANCRTAGEDVKAKSKILTKGLRLQPQDIGLAAAIGRTELQVFKPISVGVFSTGDELREPGSALLPGQIFDSNRFTIISALERLGCEVEDLGILPDQEDDIAKSIKKSAKIFNLLVTSGGMSVGDEDHVRKVIESNGVLHFWRLAIKPGRPVSLGQIKVGNRTTPFIGLPGNPVAAMVTFILIGRPLVLRLNGVKEIAPTVFRIPVEFEYKKKKGRREYVRVQLTVGDDGVTRAQKHGASGAGILSSLVGADGLLDLPESMSQLDSGNIANFLPFSEVMK